MDRRILRNILVFALCFCLCFVGLRPAPVKADAVLAAAGIAGIVIAFLAASGITLSTVDMTTQSLADSVNLWVNDWATSEGAILSDVFGVDNFVYESGIVTISPTSANSLLKFTKWLLASELIGSFASDIPLPVAPSSAESVEVAGVTLATSLEWTGRPGYTTNGTWTYYAASSDPVYFYWYKGSSSSMEIFAISTVAGAEYIRVHIDLQGNTQIQQFAVSDTPFLEDLCKRSETWSNVNVFPDATYQQASNNPSVTFSSYEGEGIEPAASGQILADSALVSLPDSIVTDVPVAIPSQAGALDLAGALEGVLSDVIAGVLEAAQVTDVALNPASPVATVPVLGLDIPSFNFNFSGIWHYVRSWIGSISTFMTVLHNVWAGLPYGMVVPVYATAAITIVVGVYRRFFA